jgi:hypothetical protein
VEKNLALNPTQNASFSPIKSPSAAKSRPEFFPFPFFSPEGKNREKTEKTGRPSDLKSPARPA